MWSKYWVSTYIQVKMGGQNYPSISEVQILNTLNNVSKKRQKGLRWGGGVAIK